MKKSVKTLIIINLLCYISYFIYSITYIYFKGEIKKWWVITAFIPYFLVIGSGFLIALNDNKKKFKAIRIIALIDLVIRISGLFINFYSAILNKTSLKFKVLILIIITFFIINILLELLMLKKANLINELNEKLPKWYEIPFEDRKNFNNMYKSIQKCFGEMIIFTIIITILLGIKQNSNLKSLIIFSIIILLLSYVYFKRSYISLKLFYKNKIEFKKAFIKESTFAIVSILIGVIMAMIRVLGYYNNEIINLLAFIIQFIIIYPKFKARAKRARKVLNFKKSKCNEI